MEIWELVALFLLYLPIVWYVEHWNKKQEAARKRRHLETYQALELISMRLDKIAHAIPQKINVDFDVGSRVDNGDSGSSVARLDPMILKDRKK